MRKQIALSLFYGCLWGCLAAQDPKGINPVIAAATPGAGQTYAVVVGISDYQDPAIPDLRFADRDAEAFANFLRSPAGGSLDGDHLKLLTNQNATSGRVAEALDWLVEQTKESDQVVIFFSGHGDVERKTISQPGFLLCWDAPAHVYMGGGTYSLAFLQEIVTTLSLQNKAKVVVVADACHAGKLSGSQIGGSQLTAANLARQYANELKILSCQPDEFSLEGEQWGGHGVFSYYLVDGLYGLADSDEDGRVTLLEIGRYLEDHVGSEAAPQRQLPLTMGNRNERLATVSSAVLADLKKFKSGQLPQFAPVEQRGFEEDVLAGVDSSIREQYFAFKKAVAEKRFFEPAENCAEEYYAQLAQHEALAPLRGFMKRNYAAALQDDAQSVLNTLLKKGVDKTLTSAETDGHEYSTYPRLLGRAAELLGKSHHFYSNLIGRKLLFEAFLATDKVSKMAKCRESLTYIPDFPLAYWWMAYTQRWNFAAIDSSLIYLKKGIEAAPTWTRLYCDYALYAANRDTAEAYLHKAYELDSTSSVYWYSRGQVYTQYAEWDSAAPAFLRAINAANQDGICFPCAYLNLANYYKERNDFNQAIFYTTEGLKSDSTNIAALNNLGYYFSQQGQPETAIAWLNKALAIKPAFLSVWINLTNAYYLSKRYAEGEIACIKALELLESGKAEYGGLSPAHIYENYADILAAIGRKEEALTYYRKAFLMFAQYADYVKVIQTGKKSLALDSTQLEAWEQTAYAFLQTNDLQTAAQFYDHAVQLDSSRATTWINLGFCLSETNHLAEGRNAYWKAIALDSTGAVVWNNLGKNYLSTLEFAQAEQALKKSIALDSAFAIPRKHLGMVCYETNRLEEARQNFRKALNLEPTYTGALLGMAYVLATESKRAGLSTKANVTMEALEYVEKAIQSGATFKQLDTDQNIAPLRASPEWKALMKKHFPEQVKD